MPSWSSPLATDLDASSKRIVTYLRDCGVPLNAVFFSYLEDEDRRYLARSWLVASDDGMATLTVRTKKGKRAEWNGRDWFASFGDDVSRSWEDCEPTDSCPLVEMRGTPAPSDPCPSVLGSTCTFLGTVTSRSGRR